MLDGRSHEAEQTPHEHPAGASVWPPKSGSRVTRS